MRCKVSVIMPSFNSELFIEESIRSIQNQTYSNWELVITDDCSTDNTVKLIEHLQEKDQRIRLYILSKNKGAGYSRNNSIKMSKGRYIAFCDSDDLWLRDKLEKQIKFMKEYNLSFSYSSYNVINEVGEMIDQRICSEKLNYSKILLQNEIGCLTAIYDRKQIGLKFMKNIRKRQDYLLWLEILREIRSTRGIKSPLANYRIRQDSISRNKIGLIKYNYQVYRYLNYNQFTSTILLILFLTNHLSKKILRNAVRQRNRPFSRPKKQAR